MYRLLLLFVCILMLAKAGAQEKPFVFSHLTEDDGLPDNVVNCFLKDSRGILWIGTYNGFSRFDGSNFQQFKKRKGPNSMANEVVHRLCEDKQGNIWGSTDNGVFCYKPLADQFINYKILFHGNSDISLNILCDRKGKIWASGSSTLYLFNESNQRFDEKVILAPSKDSVLPYILVKNGLRADPVTDGLWMATRSGIMYYDIGKNALHNFYTEPNNPLFKRRASSALTLSTNGNGWFFDNNSKDFVSFNTRTWQELKKINIRAEMPGATGGTLFEDSHQRLWFSSWTYELLVVDQQHQNRVTKLFHNNDDKRSVAGVFFWDVYEDADNNIWLGTVAGISKCNPERILFRNYKLPWIIPELKNTSIQVMEENPADSTLWIITADSLIIHYYPKTRNYQVFFFKDAIPHAGVRPVFCYGIKFFRTQVILQTRTGPWYISNRETAIRPFRFFPKGYENFKCTDVVKDGDSVLYYTNGPQLLYWNYTTGLTKLIDLTAGAEKNELRFVSALTLTRNHELWMVASATKVARLSAARELEFFEVVKDKLKDKGVMLSLDQDINGTVWVLNKGTGIYSLNPKTREVKRWDQTDGLAGNRMHKLLTDSKGRLWSMLYYKASILIPGTQQFINFRIPYSESDLGYYNHLTRLSNGHIIASIKNEITEFNPEQLPDVPSAAAPQISQLIAGRKTFSLLDSQPIVLNPGDNTIRLRFGTFINPEIFPCDMEYRLSGAENEWTLAGDLHEALYNNLQPGTYQFMVRVIGRNSNWKTEEAVVKFTIRAPFYKTTWFILLSALLLLGLVVFIYRYRLRQKEKMMVLENKAQALEKEKALVMYENLKQQLNPHFLFNSLTSLNSLIEADPVAASGFLDSLSKTYRYILKSRDNETVLLGDEIRFAENYIRLQQTRFEKGFAVNIRIPEESLHCRIVPVTLQNLIENAIKHNIVDEESPLVVNIYVEDGNIVVQNNLQKKNFVETSNRQGLSNMQSLYQYLSGRPMEIAETKESFTVKIPLL